MERLTVKRPDGRWAIAMREHDGPREQLTKIPKVIDRLAAYEDTGLEPCDIPLIDPRKWGRDAAASSVAEIKRLILSEYGVTDDRLFEILNAGKEGRLVVLAEPRQPLVWGDDDHNTVLCPNCNRDLMGGFELADPSCVEMFQCPHCGQAIDGCKAITREEAEAALAREGGGNDA